LETENRGSNFWLRGALRYRFIEELLYLAGGMLRQFGLLAA